MNTIEEKNDRVNDESVDRVNDRVNDGIAKAVLDTIALRPGVRTNEIATHIGKLFAKKTWCPLFPSLSSLNGNSRRFMV